MVFCGDFSVSAQKSHKSAPECVLRVIFHSPNEVRNVELSCARCEE